MTSTTTSLAVPTWATEHRACDEGMIDHSRELGAVPVVSSVSGVRALHVYIARTDQVYPATLAATAGEVVMMVGDVEIAADQLRPLAALLLQAADLLE